VHAKIGRHARTESVLFDLFEGKKKETPRQAGVSLMLPNDHVLSDYHTMRGVLTEANAFGICKLDLGNTNRRWFGTQVRKHASESKN
jgi:hypothetical protein